MTRTATSKLGAYVAAAAIGMVASLVLGRPELAVVAAPFVVLLAAGFSSAPAPEYRVRIGTDHPAAVEGERLQIRIAIECIQPAVRAEAWMSLPQGLRAEGDGSVPIEAQAGQRQRITIPVACERWGAYMLGDLIIRGEDRFGLFRYEAGYQTQLALKVYPRADTLRVTPRPSRTLPLFGNLVSRERGEGIELSEVRPFTSGDRVRSINWRAGARRGGIWVTDRSPERNADVVIFLDAFSDLRAGDHSILEHAVRAASSVAQALLAERNRVGLIGFGGVLRLLVPGMGRQLYQIVDALLDTKIMLSYAWKGVDVIPARSLPPRALVVAVSPLLDERSVQALLDLRGRGFDLAVLEIPPEPFVRTSESDAERLAFRVWRMQRASLRHRFERLGVAFASWSGDEPLDRAMEEVELFRRHARLARA